MEDFVDLERQRDFVQKSQQQAFGELDIDENGTRYYRYQNYNQDTASLERIKQEVLKRVSNYTLDYITMQLFSENKLALSEEERQYAEQQKRAFLIKKGVRVKQEYQNFKKLADAQRLEKARRAERAAELRESGMLGVTRDGRNYLIDCDNYTEESRLSSKKLNREVSKIARNFSDRRGTAPRPRYPRYQRGEHVVRRMLRKNGKK